MDEQSYLSTIEKKGKDEHNFLKKKRKTNKEKLTTGALIFRIVAIVFAVAFVGLCVYLFLQGLDVDIINTENSYT